MDSWKIDELSRRVDRGEEITPDEVRALITALTSTRSEIAVPSEFVVRVHRIASSLRWKAEHPVLRFEPEADHPADALVLAGRELRDALVRHAWPDPNERRARHGLSVTRIEADSIANGDESPAVVALRWSLAELDRTATELHDVKYEKSLAVQAEAGDRDAREARRASALAALSSANVTGAREGWSIDGFGSADQIGLTLPTLALALPFGDRQFDRWTFTPNRQWFALTHRAEPRPMSRHERAVVTPVALGPTAELALRRLGQQVPTGASVGAHADYLTLMAERFPAIDVRRITGPLSPAWVPLPIEALATLAVGTPDATLNLDELAKSEEFGPFATWWRLVWITDETDSDFR